MKASGFEGPVQPGMQTVPTVPSPGLFGLVFAVFELAIGFVALRLAVDEGFAAGRATFAGDGWRTALGVVGGVFSLLALRAVIRVVGGQPIPLTDALRRRARVQGALLVVLGACLLLCAGLDAVARETVAFESWTDPFFTTAGVYLVVLGFSFQLNITRVLRKASVERGLGVPGTATIAGVTELAASAEGGAVVELALEIDVNGRVYRATEKAVMNERSKDLLVPGATMDVRVDYVDPKVFQLDWNSWAGPAASQPSKR